MRLNAARILLACILCLTMASQIALPTYAWEADVHYGLTRWLAIKAGFPQEYAKSIAYYTEQPDEDKYTEAVGVSFRYLVFQRSDEASRIIGKLHFPNPNVTPPSDPLRSAKSRPVRQGATATS